MKARKLISSALALSVLLLASARTGIANKDDMVLKTPIPVTTQNAKGLPLDEEGKKMLEFEMQSGDAIADSVKEFFGGDEAVGDYGEIFMDSKNGKVIIYLAKEDKKTNELKKMLKAKFPETKFQIKKAKYSRKQLVAKQDELTNRLISLGYKNFGLGADTINDTLILEIYNLDPSLEAALIKEFGNDLVIKHLKEDKSPFLLSRTADYGTLGGGIAINQSGCSTTAIAQKNGLSYILTAGHCVELVGSPAWQNNTAIGTVTDSKFSSGLDAGLIKITSQRYISNYFFNKAESLTNYDSRHSGVGTSNVGDLVCKAGIKTGATCGNVTMLNDKLVQNGITYNNLIRITRYNTTYTMSGGGDSGGIIFKASDNKLLGIISGSNTPADYVAGTKIQDAMSSLGVSIYSSDTSLLVN